MALNAQDLANKLKKVYDKKKRNSDDVGTGADLKPPTFYVPAPKPIRDLLGLPGYPGRRITQISGRPNSGKTTLAMLAMKDAQKGHFNTNQEYVEEAINVVMADTEGKFSKIRFQKMGGNDEQILKLVPTTLEEMFVGIDESLSIIYADPKNAKEKTLVIVDSLGGTPSGAEAEADGDESIQLATAAKVIKRNLRVFVTKWLSKYDISMIVINTNYANIGSVGRSNSGGDGLEFASAFIMQLSRVSNLTYKEGEKTIQEGIVTRASVTKNHLQTDATALKDIQYEVYAYDVKGLNKFKVSKGSEFVNDDGRAVVVKVKTVNKDTKEKEVEFYLKLDNGTTEPSQNFSKC